MAALAAMWTRDRDPFWDPPSDTLLGKARVELEALRYCMGVGEEAAEAWTPVVDYKGKQVGELQVSVVPSLVPLGSAASAAASDSEGCGGEELEEYDEIGDPALNGRLLALAVTVASARGIERRFERFPSVFTQFSFFGTDPIKAASVTAAAADGDDFGDGAATGAVAPLRSNAVALQADALVPVGYAATVARAITPEMVRHFCGSALEVEVWGSYAESTAAGSAVLGGGMGAGAGMGGGSVAPAAAAVASGEAALTREQLLVENQRLRDQVAALQQELEGRRSGGDGGEDGSRLRAKLENAQQMDAAYSPRAILESSVAVRD